ncbi:hypothetical protein ADJ73_02475 [Arsenicicoccus sp. oral taxon 190]|nr:hypothetical protein ADJ73_02475 [Arsenicicoccus sp. oral taxon 190]
MTRYLASTKNIVGSVLGLGAAAVTVPTDLAGGWWPAAVVGAYAVGAAVAPGVRRRRGLVTGTQGTQQLIMELRTELQRLVDQTDKVSNRLPEEGYLAFHRVVAVLRDILQRAEQLATSPDDLHVVDRTIRDYLPTSLQAYLNLPSSYARETTLADGRTPAQELVHQMQVLEQRLGTVQSAIYAGDAQTLVDQGRFLEEKFHESRLD